MADIKKPVCSNTKCPMVLHGTCTIGRNEAGCNYEVFANTPAAKNAANVFLDNSIAPQFVKPMPKVLALVTDKADETQVFLNSTVRVDAIFSHQIEYKRGSFEITAVPEENVVIENSNILVDRHDLRNSFKVVKTGDVTFTVKYTDEKGTESTATVKITVINPEDYVAPAAEVSKVHADKTELKTGESLTVQVRTDRAIADASDVVFTTDAKLTKEGEPVLLSDKKTVKQVFKAADEGATEISVKTASGSVTKKVAVTVLDNGIAAVFQTVSANPTTVVVGKDTQVTLGFDKDPQLADVTITTDTTKLTQKVAPAISGNNVVVTYTGKAAGSAKVTCSHKGVTKEVTITVKEADPVIKSAAANPTSIQVGKDSKVTIAFDKAPVLSEVTVAYDTAKLTQKTAPAIEGANVVATYTGKATGTAIVSGTYKGTKKECTITVTPADPVMQSVTPNPASVQIGADSKVTIAFDKAPVLADVKITYDTSKLTQKVAPALEGNNVVVTYTGKAAGTANISVAYKGATKTGSITVTEVPIALNTVVAAPTSVQVGADTVVTATFSKAPELSKCTFTPSAGLTQKVAPAVSGNTIKATYTGKTAGAQNVTVSYTGITGTKKADITVTAPPAKAVLTGITANPTSAAVGADVVITCTFDKAPVLSEVTITPDATHFTEKTAKAISGNNVTVTYTVKGAAGAAKVTAAHNGVTKECTVTVTA